MTMTFEERIAALRTEHWIDLGEDHYLQPDYVGEDLVGYVLYHKTEAGDLCGGYVNLDPTAVKPDGTPRPVWTVVEKEPLTLSPSLLCNDGDHGWVQQGRWVRA